MPGPPGLTVRVSLERDLAPLHLSADEAVCGTCVARPAQGLKLKGASRRARARRRWARAASFA